MHKCHKSLVIDLVVLFRVSVLSRMYCLFSYIRQFEFNMALFGCASPTNYPLHIDYPDFLIPSLPQIHQEIF